MMLVGIDLDHTIIDYGHAFYSQACEWKLIPESMSGSKTELREYLKLQPNGHEQWMRLQGHVYGKGIGRARLMDGFKEFAISCRQKNINMVIISHKTQYGHYDADKVDLREAALQWLKLQGIFSETMSFNRSRIFFEATADDKVSRIKTLGCTHFVDDLIDIFHHKQFPVLTKSYLISQDKYPALDNHIDLCESWDDITRKIFNSNECHQL